MSMLDKIRGKFFNKKSFNVGFNNRSPLSYITSTGPSVPSFSDPGLKSFGPIIEVGGIMLASKLLLEYSKTIL